MAEVSFMEQRGVMSGKEFESVIAFVESEDVSCLSQSELERASAEKGL
jgi:hypothetical protein